MIIGFTGIELPQGKIKFHDQKLITLVNKDNPKKISPYFFEFVLDDFIQSFAIIVPKDKILDILIYDMEKIENRMQRTSNPIETKLLGKCMNSLEQEIPLCDVVFDGSSKIILDLLSLASMKPMVLLKGKEDINDIISLTIDKADYMFFYTSGIQESHAWFVPQGSDIITCAAKIHTDLARGFIKGDVVKYEDYLDHHNFNECKTKGVAKMVDKDYIVNPNEVIEIRFNI